MVKTIKIKNIPSVIASPTPRLGRGTGVVISLFSESVLHGWRLLRPLRLASLAQGPRNDKKGCFFSAYLTTNSPRIWLCPSPQKTEQ